jgi:hypothetical protein
MHRVSELESALRALRSRHCLPFTDRLSDAHYLNTDVCMRCLALLVLNLMCSTRTGCPVMVILISRIIESGASNSKVI